MNRRDLRQLAELRCKEAAALLRARCYGGAYYLAGYAIECAVKACIARKTRRYEFPDRKLAERAWSHKPGELVRLAGLDKALATEAEYSPRFAANWAVVATWSETSRYEFRRSSEARDLLRAIVEPGHGVLQWLRRHW